MTALSVDQLIEIESQGWDALCEQRGGSFYGDLMTEDALMVLVNGHVLDRDAVIASLNQSPAWSEYQIVDPRIIDLGPSATALVYLATARRSDEEPFNASMTSTYRLIDDKPRLALYTQTTSTH